MRGSGTVLIVTVLAAFAIACSSQEELTKEEREAAGISTATLMDTLAPDPGAPLLPRPEVEFDAIPTPEIAAVEKEPLLDRARMHIVLAAKALENGDTVTAVDQCTLASDRLDRASHLPGIEEDATFGELNARLRSLYRACAVTIEQSELEVPPSALAVLADEATESDSIDLSGLTFKEPPATVIPLPLNKEVEKNIVYFTTKMRKHFTKWLERSGRYFPVMRPILKEEGMPDEIIFLTMIESGVNPTARSWAACVGLWQFLKSTGEMYGLRGDWHTDDRCDPEKATRAAARHLRDLYNRFDDWHLALAAYNAGAGRISRAIKKSGLQKPTFWDIVGYLPRETQNYVPRFIATAIIALEPDEYDLAEVPRLQPLEFETVSTEKSYHVKDLAALVGTTPEEIQTLNPTLLQPVTPPRPFALRIPRGSRETFAANIASVPVNTGAVTTSTGETVVVDYRVRRGDNLYKVAKKHRVSVGQIIKANDLSSARHLRVGEILRIPKQEVLTTTASKVALDNVVNPDKENDPTKRTEGRSKLAVRVEQGMTLGGIARNFGVTVADLMTWNSMASNDRLIAGRTIDVWVKRDQPLPDGSPSLAELRAPEGGASSSASGRPVSVDAGTARGAEAGASTTPAEYTVQRGETLASIADAFNLTIQNLIDWNDLKSTNLRSGSTLKLQPSAVETAAGAPDRQEKPAAKKAVKTAPAPVSQNRTANSEKPANPEKTPVAEKAVPVENAVPTPKPAVTDHAAAARDSVYTVSKGETLYRIATDHGVTVDRLMEWNALSSASIQTGQQLVVRRAAAEMKPATETKTAAATKPAAEKRRAVESKPAAVPAAAPAAAPATAPAAVPATLDAAAGTTLETDASGMYTVQPGDNLYRIAKAAGISVEELRKLNGLKSSNLRSGQQLIVRSAAAAQPAGSTPTAAPTTAAPTTATQSAPAAGQLRSDAASRVKDKMPVKETAPKQENVRKEGRPASEATGVQHEHIVKKGETLNAIARKLGIPVSRLAEWNDTARFLKPGQKIIYYTTE